METELVWILRVFLSGLGALLWLGVILVAYEIYKHIKSGN